MPLSSCFSGDLLFLATPCIFSYRQFSVDGAFTRFLSIQLASILLYKSSIRATASPQLPRRDNSWHALLCTYCRLFFSKVIQQLMISSVPLKTVQEIGF